MRVQGRVCEVLVAWWAPRGALCGTGRPAPQVSCRTFALSAADDPRPTECEQSVGTSMTRKPHPFSPCYPRRRHNKQEAWGRRSPSAEPQPGVLPELPVFRSGPSSGVGVGRGVVVPLVGGEGGGINVRGEPYNGRSSAHSSLRAGPGIVAPTTHVITNLL